MQFFPNYRITLTAHIAWYFTPGHDSRSWGERRAVWLPSTPNPKLQTLIHCLCVYLRKNSRLLSTPKIKLLMILTLRIVSVFLVFSSKPHTILWLLSWGNRWPSSWSPTSDPPDSSSCDTSWRCSGVADTDVTLLLLLPNTIKKARKQTKFMSENFGLKKTFFEGARSKIELFDVSTDSKGMCFAIKCLTESNKGRGPKLTSFG
jgi:hypothetical protein